MTFFLPLFAILMAIHRVAFWIDEWLFPDYHSVPIREPLFLVGIPRSGTSHLHQVLARDTERFTTLTLWELIFAPSIVERRLIAGAVALDRRVGRPAARLVDWAQNLIFGFMKDIHRIEFDQPEEDYFLLLPELACFLLIHPFPYREMWRIAFLDKALPESHRRRIFEAYRDRLRRHLYFHGSGRRILSKNPAFSGAIQTVTEVFPDCRLIVNVRDPVSAAPSLISSMMEGVELFDNSTGGDRYRDKLLTMLRFFYANLARTTRGLDSKRYRVVPMKELTGDLIDTVESIYERFGWQVGPDFRSRLEEEQEKARAYKSRHKYTLEQFGLNEQAVRWQFRQAYRNFDFQPRSERGGA